MSDYTKYTKQEMQAYAIAKNIKENQIVIASGTIIQRSRTPTEGAISGSVPERRRFVPPAPRARTARRGAA